MHFGDSATSFSKFTRTIYKYVITLTQSAFLPSHQSLTSVFKFLLTLIQLQEKNRQLLDEVEHDIMNYQCRGLMLRQITQTQGLMIHVIMRKPICYAFLNQPPKGGTTRTRGLRNDVDFELDMILCQREVSF